MTFSKGRRGKEVRARTCRDVQDRTLAPETEREPPPAWTLPGSVAMEQTPASSRRASWATANTGFSSERNENRGRVPEGGVR